MIFQAMQCLRKCIVDMNIFRIDTGNSKFIDQYFVKKKQMERINVSILDRYEIIKKNGRGAYGQVWKVKDKTKKNQIVALKKIYDAFRNVTDAQRTYREVCYSQLLNHPNIVKAYDVHHFQHEKDVYMTFQYMQTDLTSLLKKDQLTQTHKYYLFYQVINAIDYLHSCELIHRDLKPSNILLNKNCEAKICDFGLIRSVYQGKNVCRLQMTQNIATRCYQAPQILLGCKKYGKAIDIWSLGCILAQMLSGKVLFQQDTTISFLQSMLKINGENLSEKQLFQMTKCETSRTILSEIKINQSISLQQTIKCSNKLTIDLLKGMLAFNPEKRLKIKQVKSHPLFFKFRNTIKIVQQAKPILIQFDRKQTLDIQIYQQLIHTKSKPIQLFQVLLTPEREAKQIIEEPTLLWPNYKNCSKTEQQIKCKKKIVLPKHTTSFVSYSSDSEFKNSDHSGLQLLSSPNSTQNSTFSAQKKKFSPYNKKLPFKKNQSLYDNLGKSSSKLGKLNSLLSPKFHIKKQPSLLEKPNLSAEIQQYRKSEK